MEYMLHWSTTSSWVYERERLRSEEVEMERWLTKLHYSVLALALRASWHLRVCSLALHETYEPNTQPEQHHHTFTMLFPSFAILAAASSLLSFATAHNIQMKAHQRECFHESLHKDDKMTVTFQVGDREFGGSGNLEIDFWVRQLFLNHHL